MMGTKKRWWVWDWEIWTDFEGTVNLDVDPELLAKELSSTRHSIKVADAMFSHQTVGNCSV